MAEIRGGEHAPLSEQEKDETESWLFWTKIIESVGVLSELSEGKVDFAETMESLRDETPEDALMLLFNYAAMITIPEGESSDLAEVFRFLEEQGHIELTDETE